MVFIFCFMVIGLASGLLFKKDVDFSEAENRALQTRPELSVEGILDGELQSQYEDYLSDQFIARDKWVNIQTWISKKLGQKESNQVFFGKDGYLLEKYSMEQFLGDLEDYDEIPSTLTSEDTQVMYNVEALADFLDNMADCFEPEHVSCVLVPSKGTVMANKLPDYAKEYDTSWLLNTIKEGMEYEVNMLDLQDVLSMHDQEYIFYKTDHHWTTLGAYYGYQAYMDRLGMEVPSLESYSIQTVAEHFLGTTYDKVHVVSEGDQVQRFDNPDTTVKRVKFADGTKWKTCYYDDALKEKDKYLYFFNGNSRQVILSGNNKNDKTLILIKDSFSNCFAPFLLEQYEHVIMIDPRYVEESIPAMIDDLLDDYDITDVLVMFNREKFMEDSSHMDYLYAEEDEDDEGGSFDE